MKNILTLVAALTLAGCAQLATVKEVKPQPAGFKVVASHDPKVVSFSVEVPLVAESLDYNLVAGLARNF